AMSQLNTQGHFAMFSRLTFLFPLLAGLACAQPAAAADDVSAMQLVVGQIKTIPLPSKVVRVAVGNGKIITSNVLETEMVVLAETPGTTSLRLWTADGNQLNYSVSVLATDPDVTTKHIRDMLSTMPGIKVERVGDMVLLTGTASKAGLPRIDAIAKLFPQTHNAVVEEEVTMRRMVYMKVQIVEMKKSLASTIGIAWDKSIAGPAAAVAGNWNTNQNFRIPSTLPSGFPSTSLPMGGAGWRPYFGLTSVITSMINLAVDNGDAFVLATPELSARSGGKAEFLAGGQIPIISPASAAAPATVTFKDYGIKLTIEPVADEKNNVSALLKTEVSNVDNSVAVGGNPGFLTRKTDSEFNVQAGQTIVLSGLVNTNLQKDVSKLAGFGDLPILGALFRSTNFQNGRTDLVIFVTPTVIDSSSGLNQERLQKAQDIQEKAKSQSGDVGILNK
ncbi:MAG: pilus assembly protein N-terminal domain-containing protein, partial [Rhodoferax sp.]|nr:pilus assembly protein N-terminal domain-containing protein [Rhodoferax sp.]